jgi:predicted TIM-barrel fold metal-dependent hydrolase
MTHREGVRRTGADIRAKLAHPVVDGDGHVQECEFALPDFLKKAGGAAMVERWKKARQNRNPDVRVTLWNVPSGPASIDRAMAMLPKFRRERQHDAGIDFAVIYTTLGLGVIAMAEDELRQAGCRALNMMNADMFSGVKDSMTPSALIPMQTPAEAIAELEFAVRELGFKTVTVGGEIHEKTPKGTRIRSVAMDSPHDYDPVWQKCMDLKVSVACHSGAREPGGRRSSPTNFVFNHLGSFANGSEYFCRSLFMAGVTRRFPELKFALLEGGVAWGCTLYNDIIEHWEKRNLPTMKKYLDPAKLDMDLMVSLFDKYGNDYLTSEQMRNYRSTFNARIDEDPDTLDDWKALALEKAEDIKDLFVPSFYFGCEADDRMVAVAFDTRLHHFGARLNACFGSDIGHWDVLDALGVVPEAHEMVEEGIVGERDFRDFVFTNNVMLHGALNPDFFKGTAVEKEAAAVLRSR